MHHVTRRAGPTPALLTFAVLGLFAAPAGAQTIFSAGYSLPETISLAPDTFGPYGGDYFIPDAVTNIGPDPHIWYIPPTGGPPTAFASTVDYHPLGGLFLPSSYGDLGGDYLTQGTNSSITETKVVAFNSSGVGTEVASKSVGYLSFSTLAPEGFGSIGGKVVISDEDGDVDTFAPDHTLSTFVNTDNISPAGVVFAPAGFGAVGGDLLVSDGEGDTIDAVTADGKVSTFATLPVPNTTEFGQPGLREMAFAPAGYLSNQNEPLLFVSVSGSMGGGGTLGNVYAVDSQGNVKYSLRDDLGLTKFDPRGLYFPDSSHLLVADASDPILVLPPSAFAPFVSSAPEPSALADCGVVALVAAGLMLKAQKRRAA